MQYNYKIAKNQAIAWLAQILGIEHVCDRLVANMTASLRGALNRDLTVAVTPMYAFSLLMGKCLNWN
jgi:hypothetical protein